MVSMSWWKWLTILLLLYVFYMGLTVPLKSGILDVNPLRFVCGQKVEIHVNAYNSFYTQSKSIRAYLKTSDSFLLKDTDVHIESDHRLKLTFELPDRLPNNNNISLASLIIDSEKDGTSVLPSKIVLIQDSINNQVNRITKGWYAGSKPEFTILSEFRFPFRNILYETIRNTFFHVSLWFSMFGLLLLSIYHSIRVLKKYNIEDDIKSYSLITVAILFGMLGIFTGSVWARFTWDTWWTNDIKLNMAALSMLIYLAYLILRANISDPDRRSKICAAYNIFALVAIIPLIFILPRLTDSLHPGNGGNPAFGSDDMDSSLRIVFYPAVIGFTLLAYWMSELLYRYFMVKEKWEELDS